MHGAELDQLEAFRGHADPLLNEEHRTGRIQLDQEREDPEQRREDYHPDDRDQQADRSAGGQIET